MNPLHGVPPELVRRAAAFDRVFEALRAVAELRDEDVRVVLKACPDAPWLRSIGACAVDLLAALGPADRELNSALEALDTTTSVSVSVT